MPDSFDRDATIKALPRIADGLWEYLADTGTASDETLTALDDVMRAARWAVQITENADALLSEKICDLPDGYEDPVPCSGVHRKVVWEGRMIDLDRLREAVRNTDITSDGVVYQSRRRDDQAVLFNAARLLLEAVDEGDGELWHYKPCPTHGEYEDCLNTRPDARCVGGSRVRVWPKELPPDRSTTEGDNP